MDLVCWEKKQEPLCDVFHIARDGSYCTPTQRWLNKDTVEPPNNGHIGDNHFVNCSEVVPSSEVEMKQGVNSLGRLSTLQIVHYRRFHCN